MIQQISIRILSLLLLTAMLFACIACGSQSTLTEDSGSAPPSQPPDTVGSDAAGSGSDGSDPAKDDPLPNPNAGITLDRSTLTLQEGQVTRLHATFIPAFAEDDVTLSYHSANEAVATVDQNGNVTAKAQGVAQITVEGGSYAAICLVTVKKGADPNAGIRLEESALTLAVGQVAQLHAVFTPAFPEDDTTLSYRSANEAVATVDQNGKITAKAAGAAEITVSCGDYRAVCRVTVEQGANPDAGITLEADTLRLLRGKSHAIKASFLPEYVGDSTRLYYSVDNTSTVQVDEHGVLTALAAGTATVTVTNANGKYKKTLKVTVPQSFSFLAAGDNLLHSGVYNDAKERAGGSGYNFLPIYAAIADKVAGADFAMINQEGVFTGSGVSSYPKLNAPQEGIKALADLGFDIISLANNHCLDMGGAGLAKSMTYLDTLKGVIRLGGYFKKNNDALKTRVIEKDGIKVALLAYTTFTNGNIPSDYNSSGVYVPWVEPYENTLNDIARAKTKADAVLVFMHWGDEEQFAVTDRQKQIAKMLVDGGVDVIVGAHPHVIQPVEYIEAADGRRVPCIYSLGTLVSNMMTEQNMLSCLVSFDFVKDPESGKITVENIEMDPYVFYYNMSFRQCALYRLPDLTEALAASHGIGNYPKDSAVKNTMSIPRLYGYLREYIDPAFLPDDIKKELSK